MAESYTSGCRGRFAAKGLDAVTALAQGSIRVRELALLTAIRRDPVHVLKALAA